MAAAALLLFLAGAATGRATFPARVEVVRERVEVERHEEQIDTAALAAEVRRLVQEESTRRNVTSSRKTVKAPDGTVTEEETTRDLSETSRRSESSSTALSEVQSSLRLLEDRLSVEREHRVVTRAADYRLSLGVGTGFTSWQPTVELRVERRLVGPLHACLWGRWPAELGACLALAW